MALLTLIARASDGLPLSASILNDEVREKCPNSRENFDIDFVLLQSGRNVGEYQTRAKQIFRKLSDQSPKRCTIESDPLVFQ